MSAPVHAKYSLSKEVAHVVTKKFYITACSAHSRRSGYWTTTRLSNTATWMKLKKADRFHVSRLKCSICERFVDKLKANNFSPAYIEASSFRDHARSDMQQAMRLLRKEQSSDVLF